MRNWKPWAMPKDDIPSFLRQLEEKIRSSNIGLEHRDRLIRLRAILEADLADEPEPVQPDIVFPDHVLTSGDWDRILMAALLDDIVPAKARPVDEPDAQVPTVSV